MKISLKNLERIMDRCTKKEIDLMMYISQFQDNYGIVKGIDYKEVITNIQIRKSTFYKLLYSLEEKAILEINYFNEHGYWEVTIIDNVFACEKDYKKGYLKINYEVLHSEEFKKMTKSEKLIVINLIKINDFRIAKIKITYKKIKEWTDKSMRSVKKFIKTLKSVFNIIQKDNSCLIDCCFGFGCRVASEVDIRNKHLIEYRLKKEKSELNEKYIKDTITVLKQYRVNSIDMIIQLVDKSINDCGTLMPKYINTMGKLLNKSNLLKIDKLLKLNDLVKVVKLAK